MIGEQKNNRLLIDFSLHGNELSRRIFFSDDKKLKEYPLKPTKGDIYAVLVSFDRDPKKPNSLYPTETFIGPIDDLKTYYIEYLQSK